MPWFLTPHGPHFVVEPGTVDEYERRDYVEMTAQQVTDYYAGVAIPEPSFATEAEVPGIVAADIAGGTGPVAVAARAAFVSAVVLTDFTSAGLTAAAAVAGAGGTVVIPRGETLVLNTAVTLTSVSLVGVGGVASISVPTSLGSGVAALTITGAGTNVEVANFTLTGPGVRSLAVKTANCDGIAVTGQAKPKFRNIKVRQFDSGLVWNNDVGHIYHDHIDITDNYYGIYCKKNTFDYFITDSGINGNTFANFATPADQGISASVFQNVHCGFAPYGFYQEPTPAAQGTPKVFLQEVMMRHVRFEAIGNGAILTDATQDASNKSSVSNLLIEHPGFSWNTTYRIAERARDYAVSFNQTERVIEIVAGPSPFLAGDVNRIRVKQAGHEALVLRGSSDKASITHVTTDAGNANVVAVAAPLGSGSSPSFTALTIAGDGTNARLNFDPANPNRYVRFNNDTVRLGGDNASFNADFSTEFAWRNSGSSYAKVGRVTTTGISMPAYFLGAAGVTTGPRWTSGTGTPEGVVTAPVGSTYSRTDGGAGTSFYVKESGTGNTGWVAK